MGPALLTDLDLLHLLSREPDSVVWVNERDVTLKKDPQGKLGLKVEVFKVLNLSKKKKNNPCLS